MLLKLTRSMEYLLSHAAPSIQLILHGLVQKVIRHWPYLPSSSRETYKPTPVQGINLYTRVDFASSLSRGHPMKKLYAVMNAAYGTIGHVLKCAPKIIACYNAQTYSGCAVGAKHLIYQASPSEALKSLQVFTNQLLMKTSLWNHSLQPSTHSSLAVPNQQTNTCQRIQQEGPIIHHAPPTKQNSPAPEQAHLHLTSHKRKTCVLWRWIVVVW